MTVSNNQWLSSAHVGDWVMDVDDRQQPTKLILCRGQDVVLMLPITSAADVATVADRLSRAPVFRVEWPTSWPPSSQRSSR